MENMCLAFENRCLGITASKERLPLLLVTGFLGSGKTTLLRHLLGNKSNLRLAVLVNELGTIDIDGALLRSTDNNAGLGICTQELTNGCLCCTVKDDLRRAVLSVLERRDSVDYLVIETSGAADPRPVAAALAQLCRLDLVVTVVDGTAAVQQAHMALFRSQLGAADLVLLNKSDLLDDTAAQAAEAVVVGTTKAKIVRTSHGSVPLDLILDLQVQAASTGADTSNGFLSHDGKTSDVIYTVGGRPHFHDKSTHVGFDLHSSHPPADADSDPAFGQHGHEHAHAHTPATKRMQEQGEGPVRGKRGLKTVSLKFEKCPLSLAAFERLVARLTCDDGKGNLLGRIWRAKGFVWLAEARQTRWEFQLSGIGRVDLVEDAPWSSAPLTQVVIIGEDLDEAALDDTMRQCQTSGASSTGAGLEDQHGRQLAEAVRLDPNFEVVEDNSDDGGASPVLFGFKETDDMRLHGVYARNLNKELVSAVNALRLPLLALPYSLPSATGTTMVMMCATGAGDAGGSSDERAPEQQSATAFQRQRWQVVREVAYKILESKCIVRCKCAY